MQKTSRRQSEFLEHFYRADYAAVVSGLAKKFGTEFLELIEDNIQEALIATLEQERNTGDLPRSARAWIFVLAKHRILNALKRNARFEDRLNDLEPSPRPSLDEPGRDDIVRLMFFCCHPNLKISDQSALTLNLVFGFRAKEIAAAYLLPESTVAQRLTRAKKRLRNKDFELIAPDLNERLQRYGSVLHTLYLLFGEGYHASTGDEGGPLREEFCRAAIRALESLREVPELNSPSACGLAALLYLQAARFPARTNQNGDLLLLHEQDRSQWDRVMIAEGLRLLSGSATGEVFDDYRLLATIAALHATADSFDETDWARITEIYELLYSHWPTPVIGLNYGIAIAMSRGNDSGIKFLESLPGKDRLRNYWLYYSSLGELYRRSGRDQCAVKSFQKARSLTSQPVYVRFLDRRMCEL